MPMPIKLAVGLLQSSGHLRSGVLTCCIIARGVIENTAVAQYQMSVRVTISCGEVQKEEYERSRFSTQRSTLRHTEPGPRQPLPAGPARVRQPL